MVALEKASAGTGDAAERGLVNKAEGLVNKLKKSVEVFRAGANGTTQEAEKMFKELQRSDGVLPSVIAEARAGEREARALYKKKTELRGRELGARGSKAEEEMGFMKGMMEMG